MKAKLENVFGFILFIGKTEMITHEELKVCANCGLIIEESYYMVGDNFLQIKYFDEEDGSDNVFCSRDCLCEALSVLQIDLEEELK